MKVLGYISLLFFSVTCFSQTKTIKKSIYFESGISTLNSEQRITIDSLLSANVFDSISLIGYTDSVGNQKNNLALANKRCLSVQSQIQKINAKTKMSFFAKGENSRLNTSKWQQRRVDVVLFIKIKAPIEIKPNGKTTKVIAKKQIITPTERAFEKPNQTPPKQEFNDALLDSDKIVINNLQFEPGSARFIHDKAPNELYYLADLLKKQPSMRVVIVGHVCCVDDKKLSVERAKKVVYFLKSKGVQKKQLSAKGMSNSEPLVEEITKADQQTNRRVEIIILER